MARPPQGSAGPPLAHPARRDRAAARDPRRLPDRLSQPRRGDPHHPRGGRAEAGADGALRADRHAGRSHPQHAAARACASSRKSRSARSIDGSVGREGADRGAARLGRQAVEDACLGNRARSAKKFGPDDARSASAAPPSPMRPTHDVADIAPCDDREGADHRRRLREGLDPRAEGPSHRLRRRSTFKEGDRLQARLPRRRPPTRSCCSPPAASSSRSAPTKLPGGRGHGEPIRIMVDMDNDQDVADRLRPRPGPQAAARLAPPATASSCRRPRSSPTPARASR